MKRLCIIALSCFTVTILMSGCSREHSSGNQQSLDGKKSLAEKTFENEPKAPASALNGMDDAVLLEEEHSNSFE